MAMPTDLIGVILLAAGASGRLGEPKQLLKFQGETLLRRAAKTALASSSASVVITLGSRIEIMRKEVEDLPVKIVENKDWETGMSGSIRAALKKFLEDELKAVVVMVCDQPFVDENLLKKIITKFQETDALVVACAYQNTLGTPALFHRKLFPELLALNAQAGAKQLIKKYNAQTAAVSFPEGAFDIDTRADYKNLMKILTNESL